ncbi:hypothetical protein KFK09_024197 [Dendrobium nobile]|uniref:Uncharacterized protein n=1 Tax=Dendrobium nobile TaxID=94219 RepID=A0A8T3AC02_DENNO|nr:hypothetical protein KFK09_024197 [Dendrobium nobile]
MIDQTIDTLASSGRGEYLLIKTQTLAKISFNYSAARASTAISSPIKLAILEIPSDVQHTRGRSILLIQRGKEENSSLRSKKRRPFFHSKNLPKKSQGPPV